MFQFAQRRARPSHLFFRNTRACTEVVTLLVCTVLLGGHKAGLGRGVGKRRPCPGRKEGGLCKLERQAYLSPWRMAFVLVYELGLKLELVE